MSFFYFPVFSFRFCFFFAHVHFPSETPFSKNSKNSCTDRPKLLFDTLCTLADLDYDVYHASIDSTDKVKEGAAAAAAGSGSSLSSHPPSASANGASAQCHPGDGGGGGSSSSRPCGLASQEYYIRPRDGNADWDAGRAEQLVAMLEASIQRRFPRGLKVHVRSADRFGCLAALAGVLRGAALAVTRAKVRTYAATGGGHNRNNSSRNHVAGPSAGHTLYVMAASGGPPDRAAVEAADVAAPGTPEPPPPGPVAIGGGLVLDAAQHVAVLDGERVMLTPAEFDLLNALSSRPGTAWERGDLVREVWQGEFIESDFLVDVHIGNVRRKLRRAGSSHNWIRTIDGAGYVFEVA